MAVKEFYLPCIEVLIAYCLPLPDTSSLNPPNLLLAQAKIRKPWPTNFDDKWIEHFKGVRESIKSRQHPVFRLWRYFNVAKVTPESGVYALCKIRKQVVNKLGFVSTQPIAALTLRCQIN